MAPIRPWPWLLAALAIPVAVTARGAGSDEPPALPPPRPRLVAQLGHTHWSPSVAMSEDGRWVLTASWDGSAKLWERETGREVRTYQGPGGVKNGLGDAAISPDARWVLAMDAETVLVWERVTGRTALALQRPVLTFTCAAFAHGLPGLLTGNVDGTVTEWDVASGRHVRSFLGSPKAVTAVGVSRDGRTIVGGSIDGSVRRWNRGNGALLGTLTGDGKRVESLCLSVDGGGLLATGEGGTRLWDLESGTLQRTLDPHTPTNGGAAFSPDGLRVLTVERLADADVSVWDRGTGALLATLPAPHGAQTTQPAFSPDGRWCFGWDYGLANAAWEAESGKSLTTYTSQSSALASARIVAGGSALLTSDGTVMAGRDPNDARWWDLGSGRGERVFRGHTSILADADASADGRWVVTASWDRTARLWAQASGRELRQYPCGIQVLAVAITADGQIVATGSDDGLTRLWEREGGGEPRQFGERGGGLYSVAFSPDGHRVAAGDGGGRVRVWEVDTGREMQQWYVAETVMAVGFSADGRRLYAGAGARAWLWDVEGGAEVRRFAAPGAGGGFASTALSRDGTRLLAGDYHGDRAVLWDVESGRELRRLEAPGSRVMAVAFSDDGRWAFTGGVDGRTRVWDVDTGAERCSLIGFRDGTWAVVDTEGRYDASHDGHVGGLHWVLGDEVVTLEQLQSAYYEPGLLAKILEGRPLLQVPDFARIGLFPVALATPPTATDPRLRIDLENRGGGIGRVVVKIDGTAIATDVRGGGADPAAARAHVDVDLAHHPLLTPGRESTITVEAFNADGSLRSRGIEVRWTPPGEAETAPPALWAVVCGVSDYHGEALDLRYAAKDALAFADALAASAEGLFGAGHVHVTTLATEGGRTPPTRANLEAALRAARAARRDDVFVLYLSGHGVTAGTPPDYGYLTQEASSTDLALEDVRATRAVTAAVLEEWLRWIPARKKVLVFDTCRAGEAAKRLGDRGADAGDQKRALARVRQALGTYMLAGCAADRVSYEASRYGQGLLTYALLEGMKIGAKEATREGDLLEAMGLLSYAMRRVPELARGVGGLQEPQLSVPDLATPIDLGRLTAVTKERIRLAGERPLFVKPAFDLATRPGDPLGLTKEVATVLRTATDPQGAARAAYVEVDSGEGALKLAGRYVVDGTRVKVHVYLTRVTATGEDDLGELDVEGALDARPQLARSLVERALALLGPR